MEVFVAMQQNKRFLLCREQDLTVLICKNQRAEFFVDVMGYILISW